jgi:hypothetical protein
MASLTKFISDPKGYTKKKVNSAVKTVKDQPLSIASGVLGIMANVADQRQKNRSSHGKVGLGARANVLNALGQGAQLWANAKAQSKAKDGRFKVAEIISDNGLSDDEKYEKLIGLGEFKVGESIKNRGQFKQMLGHKQDVFGETKKQNAISNAHNDRDYAQRGTIHNDSMNFGYYKEGNKDKRWQAGEDNSMARTVVQALGTLGKTSGMTQDQLVDLINNNGKIQGIEIKSGKINNMTGSKRVITHDPKTLTKEEERKFKAWLKANGKL